MEYQISIGHYDDIAQVSILNCSWLTSDFMTEDTSNGFLFGDPFSVQDLANIVSHDEIIVAKFQNRLVGYYLLDNGSKTRILREHEQMIALLVTDGVIPPDGKVSKRMQCVVDRNHQMKGLSLIMLQHLLRLIGHKYDLLFATVSKYNPKLAAHLRSGWQIIGENDTVHFIGYYVQ